MSKAIWFCSGAVSAALLFGLGGIVLLRQSAGFSTREAPGSWERAMARWAHSASLPSEAKMAKNPISSNPEVIVEARAHWADHCASCHGNDGSGATAMGGKMFPRPPDMRLAATQELSDGELFYIIKYGVRLTGMPAWGDSDDDDVSSWKLVHFIRKLPALTADELKLMEGLNPRSPDEFREEEEERRFLRGEEIHETTQHSH